MTDKPREDDDQIRGFVVRISYKVQIQLGQEATESTVVPSFMAKWIAADLAKRSGVRPESISLSKDLPVRIDQYNAAIRLREAVQRLDLAALKVAVSFANSNEHDTLHPETCLAIIELAQRGVEELRQWVNDPLNYMVGKGFTTAIPFPPRNKG